MIDSSARSVENRIHLFDPVGLINDTYGVYSSGGGSFQVKPRKATATRSLDSFSTSAGELKFAVDHDSDASSPRLWKQCSPSVSPKRATHIVSPFTPSAAAAQMVQPIIQLQPQHLHYSQNHQYDSHNQNQNRNKNLNQQYDHRRQMITPNENFQVMSPKSRTETIAMGRRELMEMIKDMPESLYELSLKDIVEQAKYHQRPPSPRLSPAPSTSHVLNKSDIDRSNGEDEKFTTKEVVTVIETSLKGKNPGTRRAEKEKEIQKAVILQKKNKGGWSNKKVRKSESKKKMVKSKKDSTDKNRRRFLLRTSVFPISLEWKKKKKKKNKNKNKKRQLTSIASFTNANPEGSSQNAASMKQISMEKDNWWTKRSCMSSQTNKSELSSVISQRSESSSASSCRTSSSIISGRMESRRFLPSCCSFFSNKAKK